jgi:hypothetical protein
LRGLARAYIEITNHCGLNCEFCEPKKSAKAQMSIGIFEKIHKELSGRVKEISYHILGDPLTINNLDSYLDISASYNIPVSLTTSGFYVKNFNQNTLLHPAIKQINFSLSSFHANNQKLFTLEEYLAILCDFAKKSSANPKRFVNFRLWNEGNANYTEFNNHVVAYLSSNFGVNIDTNDKKTKLASYTLLVKDGMFEWPSIQKAPIYNNGTCHAINGQIGFLVDGAVVPCCLDAHGDMPLGSILTSTLPDIVGSPKAVEMLDGFRKNLLVQHMCKTCGFRDARL